MAKKPKSKKAYAKRVCAARDCSASFTPRVKGQIFHSRACYNRESQMRYRERQKAAGATA